MNTFLFVSMMAFVVSCNGQTSSPHSIDPALEHGTSALPGDTVASLDDSIWIIFQDANGHHWFGSDGQGVYRYDGNVLLHYSTDHGLPGNRIRGIQEDRSGNVFISTLDGISKFDGRSFHTLPVVESNEWSTDTNDLWFSVLGKANDKGPYRFDGKILHHLKLPRSSLEDAYNASGPNPSFSPFDVYSIYRDSKGDLWFGTSNFGVCRFDGSSHDWLYEDHWTNTPEGGSFGIRSMIEDREGNFWFCNTKYRYDIHTNSSTGHGNDPLGYDRKPGVDDLNAPDGKDVIYFMSAITDDKGDIWMATYGQGVWKYDGTKATHYSVAAGSHAITLFSIYKDRQGAIWLGTQSSGAYKFNGKAFERFDP